VFHYLTVPIATFFGWLFWDEALAWQAVAGGVLICAAGIFASLPARAPAVNESV
jgi:drug/metabolite transporter (DMT)-like permease